MRALLALLGLMAAPAAALADPAIEIVSEAVEDGYALSAVARTDAAFAGRASLTIDRRGQAGTARTSQSGTLALAPGESAVIARGHLSFTPGDTLAATAILYDETGTEIDRANLILQ